MSEEESKIFPIIASHQSIFVKDGEGDHGEENETRMRHQSEVEENQPILKRGFESTCNELK